MEDRVNETKSGPLWSRWRVERQVVQMTYRVLFWRSFWSDYLTKDGWGRVLVQCFQNKSDVQQLQRDKAGEPSSCQERALQMQMRCSLRGSNGAARKCVWGSQKIRSIISWGRIVRKWDSGEVCGWSDRWIPGGCGIKSGISSEPLLVCYGDGQVGK